MATTDWPITAKLGLIRGIVALQEDSDQYQDEIAWTKKWEAWQREHWTAPTTPTTPQLTGAVSTIRLDRSAGTLTDGVPLVL